MSRHTIIKITLAALALLAIPGVWWMMRDHTAPAQPSPDTQDAQTSPQEDTAAYSGECVNSAKEPVAGVVLTCGKESVTTDQDGAFSFKTLCATLAITPPKGYVLPPHLREFPIDSEAPPTTLTLYKPRALSGKILAGGTPLQDTKITLLYTRAQAPTQDAEPFALDTVATTGDGGEFKLEGLLPGSVHLLVESREHPFYKSSPITISPRASSPVIIDIAPETQLILKVISSTGDDLSGQTITVQGIPQGDPQRIKSWQLQASPNSSTISLRGLELNTPYRLLARAQNYQHALLDVAIEGSTTQDLIMEPVDPGYSGIVLDSDFVPVKNAPVQLRAGAGRPKVLRTDSDGRFAIAADKIASPVAQVLSPFHPTSEQASLRTAREHLFTLGQGGYISGQVISSDGRPIPAYALSVTDMQPAVGPRRSRTSVYGTTRVDSAQGDFTLGPLRPGTYYLRAQPDDLASAQSQPISVSAAQTTSRITLTVQQSGTISGTISDGKSGRPIASARVELMESGVRASLSTTTNAQGAYTLENVPPGRRSVRVTHRGHTTEVAAGIEVSPAGHSTQDVTLEKGNSKKAFSFHGIGAVLGKDDRGVIIQSVMKGSPAMAAGVQNGDHIISVDGKVTDNMRVQDVVQIVRGQEGTPVVLDVARKQGGRTSLTVTRGKVNAARGR